MTTTTAPKPVDGLPATYARAVPLGQCAALADPELIRQHEDLLAWPALIARWRELSWGERFGNEAPALPLYNGRSVGSPQMVPQATLDAAGDLDRDVRARLADDRLRILAFQEPRQLDGRCSMRCRRPAPRPWARSPTKPIFEPAFQATRSRRSIRKERKYENFKIGGVPLGQRQSAKQRPERLWRSDRCLAPGGHDSAAD